MDAQLQRERIVYLHTRDRFCGHGQLHLLRGNGTSNSSIATVTITVASTGLLFSDDFTRSPIPARRRRGRRNRGRGRSPADNCRAGSERTSAYGQCLLSKRWLDKLHLAGAGAVFFHERVGRRPGWTTEPDYRCHYAACVYPENSGGGSAVLKLIKFEGWSSWAARQCRRPAWARRATNWHTLALTFAGANIAVSFDGVQKIRA